MPPHGLDLSPGSRDTIKVEMLEQAFRTRGFDKTKAALFGYPLNGKVQLLTGTHRHEAARRVGMYLPVRMTLRSVWYSIWGTDEAMQAAKDIPVCDLELVPVGEPKPAPGIDEIIDPAMAFDYENMNLEGE